MLFTVTPCPLGLKIDLLFWVPVVEDSNSRQSSLFLWLEAFSSIVDAGDRTQVLLTLGRLHH